MKFRISKTIPDPTKPKEVFNHYLQHLARWAYIFYIDRKRNWFGQSRKKRYVALEALKNSGKGRCAFVLASGPSINKIDPQKLKAFKEKTNSDIFCVNYFVSSEFASQSGVDYWLLSDPRHFDFSIPDTLKAFSEAENTVGKGILSSEFHATKIANKTYLPIIPFNDFETSWILSNNINPLYPRSFLTLSAYKALAIATYCGYEKIYICGFDNTYIRDLGCDENNKLYRIINHFYLDKSKVNDSNYFRDYKMGVGPNEKPRNRNVSQELLAYSRLFSDLDKFKNYPIVNLDVDSLTDAFPKSAELDIYKN